MKRLSPIFFWLVASIGCGGTIVPQGAQPDGGGGSGGTGPTAPLVSACPQSAPPVLGTSCADTGLLCEYGSDRDWECNVVAHCNPSHTWESGTGGGPQCPSPPLGVGPGCPPSHAAAAQGGTCSTDQQVCAYPEGICVCTPPPTIGPGMPDASIPPSAWQCAMTSAGCPPFRPRIGSACSMPDLVCDYGVCGTPPGSAYQCDAAGYWTDAFGMQCGGA
jgi:hypothetical protein